MSTRSLTTQEQIVIPATVKADTTSAIIPVNTKTFTILISTHNGKQRNNINHSAKALQYDLNSCVTGSLAFWEGEKEPFLSIHMAHSH